MLLSTAYRGHRYRVQCFRPFNSPWGARPQPTNLTRVSSGFGDDGVARSAVLARSMSNHAAGNGDIMHAGTTSEPKAALDLFALLHNLKVQTPMQ